MERIKEFFKEFFETRTVGFYIMLAAAVLALVQDIIYISYYQSSNLLRYYSQPAFIIPIFAVVACLALSMFKVTHKWAPLVLYGLELCAFCLFVEGTYMYLTQALFGGFSIGAIFRLSPGFWLSALLYLIIFGLCIAAVFLNGRKEVSPLSENEVSTEEAVTENQGGNE